MRMSLLKLGEDKVIDLNNLSNFFDEKGIYNVSLDEIKDQLEHLLAENSLSKKSDNEYKLTQEGKKELADVKIAIEKF